MPNLGRALREEIVRLSRRELRGQLATIKKASAAHRRDIAALKREVSALEAALKRLMRAQGKSAPRPIAAATGRKVRFSAKGLRSQRQRLGLSARELGVLLGVSAQSVYNWESESARPRRDQIARLAALRGLGKRAVQQRLEQS
jgi:DNA-binding transcriptional regulator YiaG